MSTVEWSAGRKRMIEEQAKEELEALQILHPGRFDYLKLELESFIHLLRSQSQQFSTDEWSRRSPRSLDPDSQESSSNKRRKVEKLGSEMQGDELEKEITASEMRESERRRRNRVEAVLERAVVCLRKIRRFKTALFSDA